MEHGEPPGVGKHGWAIVAEGPRVGQQPHELQPSLQHQVPEHLSCSSIIGTSTWPSWGGQAFGEIVDRIRRHASQTGESFLVPEQF